MLGTMKVKDGDLVGVNDDYCQVAIDPSTICSNASTVCLAWC